MPSRPIPKQPKQPNHNIYSPLEDSSSQSTNLLEDETSQEESTKMPSTASKSSKNKSEWKKNTTTPQRTTAQCAAAKGLKTFHGNPAQEKAMLIKALRIILTHEPKHPMRSFITKDRAPKLLSKLEDTQATLTDLQKLATQIVIHPNIQVTSTTPYQIKYNPSFLDTFYKEDEHPTSSQSTTTNVNIHKTPDRKPVDIITIPDEETKEHENSPPKTPGDDQRVILALNQTDTPTTPAQVTQVTPSKPIKNPYSTKKTPKTPRHTQLTLTQMQQRPTPAMNDERPAQDQESMSSSTESIAEMFESTENALDAVLNEIVQAEQPTQPDSMMELQTQTIPPQDNIHNLLEILDKKQQEIKSQIQLLDLKKEEMEYTCREYETRIQQNKELLQQFDDDLNEKRNVYHDLRTRNVDTINQYSKEFATNIERITTKQSREAEKLFRLKLFEEITPKIQEEIIKNSEALSQKYYQYKEQLEDSFEEKYAIMRSMLDSLEAQVDDQINNSFEQFKEEFVETFLPNQGRVMIEQYLSETLTDAMNKTISTPSKSQEIHNRNISEQIEDTKLQLQEQVSTFQKDTQKLLITLQEQTRYADKTIKDRLNKSLESIEENKQEADDHIAETTATSLKSIRNTARREQDTIIADTTLETLINEGTNTLQNESTRHKRELQADKDRILQALQADKDRIIQSLQTDKEKAIQALQDQRDTSIKIIKSETQNIRDLLPQTYTPDNVNNQNEMNTQPELSNDIPPSHATETHQQEEYNDRPKHNFAARIANRQREELEEQIIARSIAVHNNITRLQKAPLEDIITSTEPTPEVVETYYQAMESTLLACGIPIVLYENLTPTSGTRPQDERERLTPEVTTLVNKTIFQRLAQTIPLHTTRIRSILDSYSNAQDGYGALNMIMKTYCDYLKTLQPPWGPTWEEDMDGHQYLSLLRRRLQNLKRTNQTHYSQHAIACEILQQAKRIPRYNVIATLYLTRLQLQPSNQPLGTEYNEAYLVGELENNQSTESNYHPTINKFNSYKDGKDNGKDNTRRNNFKFKYRREVQCSCCHAYGHDIDEDVCRIGAQTFHSHQFWVNYADKAKKNATAYSMANNRNQVKNTRQVMPDASSEEINEHLESVAHSMMNQFPETIQEESPKDGKTLE